MNSLKAAAPSIVMLRTRSQRIVRQASTQHQIPLNRFERRLYGSNYQSPCSRASTIPDNGAHAGRPRSIWHISKPTIWIVGMGCSILVLALSHSVTTLHIQQQGSNDIFSMILAFNFEHARKFPQDVEYVQAFIDDYEALRSKYIGRLDAVGRRMVLQLRLCAQQHVDREGFTSAAIHILESSIWAFYEIFAEAAHETLHARPMLEAKAGNWRDWTRAETEKALLKMKQNIEMYWEQYRQSLLDGKGFDLFSKPV